jgi:hypothetical protein
VRLLPAAKRHKNPELEHLLFFFDRLRDQDYSGSRFLR